MSKFLFSFMNKISLQSGDVYTLQDKETGKWFAFQIVQIGEENAVYIDLDYWNERIPEERDLGKMSYLRLNHHFYDNKISQCWAPFKLFPSHAKRVGNMVIKPFEECHTYGGWPNGLQQKLTEKWDKHPKDQVLAFKEVRTKWKETTIVAGKEVGKALYELSDDILGAVSDFSELDSLPGLGCIITTKDYPQLIPYLERRYLIRELRWGNCKRQELDLSRTHLEEIEINGENIERIVLPPDVITLTLRGKMSPNLRIHSPHDGCCMVLRMELQDDFLPDVGLNRLTNLRLTCIRDFHLKCIPLRFPGLRWLGLAGKPGYIRGLAEISKLRELETLTMDDLFGFTADDFPRPEDLPELRHLWLESIPAEAGKAIKQLYKRKVPDVHVTKSRSVEWMDANLLLT